ncbi:putative dual-specificity RNA methyltransferase RlmN [bacterium BMS3Abin03]|nr:putative dual-specificity RNA methyltransferase RlmN [bacterium BMS3Abin03]
MKSEEKGGNDKKPILKGYTLKELKDYFSSIDEKRFRGEQIFNWLYSHLIDSYEEMQNVPKTLRERLSELTGPLNTLKLVTTKSSPQTGTKKYLFETLDGHKIESVIIPEIKRTTLCISTQVGCPLDCKFCATGLMGYKKNLSAGEIFDQYKFTVKDLEENSIKNIVYMGMGEPLLNYDETLKSLEIFANDLTKGAKLKRITVSTAGIAPKIVELADSGMRVKLALSLHSCFEDIRSKLMPINEKYSLKENLHAIRHYTKQTRTRITFEYIMISGINDREEDFIELVKLCKSMPCKINVIPFNSLAHIKPSGFSAELRPSPFERVEAFVQALRDQNIIVTVRYTQGEDIAAACGQLAIVENEDEKINS